jgi:arylsulfatase A-like enzyme
MGRTTQWLLVALLLVGLFAAQHYYRFRSFFGPKLEYVAGASEPPKSPGAEFPRPPEWREHPDIILISVDTLRSDHLGVYAYPRETSPAIDHFARDGVIFERAFVTAPKTTPSLASLLSGLAVKTHKIYDLRMPVGDSIPLVPEMLKEVGYATAGFCGQFNCDERFKLNRGFDHYDGDFSTIEENDAHSRAGGGFHPNSERRAEYLVDAATAWISERDPGEAPVFVWLHLMDPHAGYAAPSPYPDMFSGPSIFSDQSLSGPKIPMRLIQDQALDGEIDDYDYYLNRYDAEIRYLDDRLGRFFATLRERGHYDDALILFTSDHGEYMGESTRSDRYFHHGGTLFDSEVRVPLVVKFPGKRYAGSRVERVVSLVDLAPTILAVASGRADHFDGYDLRLALSEEGAGHGEHTVFIQRPHARGTFAVQTQRHKLVVRTWVKTDRLIARLRDGDRINARFLLYDLEQDPLQRNDIAKANPERVTELSARLAQWLVAEPSIDSVGPSKPLPDAETLEHLRALGYVE